jgi:putative tryptophan/tyrosine transport system substrate-binding protein
VPKLARVTVLLNPGNAAVVLSLQETRATAKMLDLSLDSIDVREPREFARAFSAVVEKRPDGLVLLLDSMILSERTSVAEFALEHRLPSISPFREFTEAGGLLDYGVSVPDISSTRSHLYRQNSSRRKAQRIAGRATGQIRVGHQP